MLFIFITIGGRWGKQPGIDGMVAFERKMFPVVFFGAARCGTVLTFGKKSAITYTHII